MPQEIRVICCFKCKVYQVDIVKKAKKWQCKMCNEKQSVFKEFYRGTGADCRKKAQELNLTSNSKQIEDENNFLDLLERDLEIDFDLLAKEELEKSTMESSTGENKWAQYVDSSDQVPLETVQNGQNTNLKRKTNSSAEGFEKSKSAKTASSSNSKWNTYL